MSNFQSTKVIELGSCAFRQPNANSHCRWLHGYRLQAKFWFGCDELDDNNWVVDFGALKGLKQKMANMFDHTTCISADDPALSYFKELASEDICDLRIMENGVGIERFAEYCFDTANNYIKKITKNRCHVEKVEVWEHEKNSATFTENTSTSHHIETSDTNQQELDLRLDNGEPLTSNEKVTITSEELAEDIATAVDNKQAVKKSSGSVAGSWLNKENVAKKNSYLF